MLHACFHLVRPGFTLDVDMSLPDRGITALFGHSGSGKTTCLRLIAGLERAPGGQVRLGDTIWQDEARGIFLPTHQRPLGYVFQEASLFPHLSARQNMVYGQKRSLGREDGAHLQAVSDLLGLDHLLSRKPAELSGGERQRVAIARALLTNPQLLLMDEPLAALDLKRKLEILPYLERLHDELQIPILYVSHAPDEVARLADHLVLLDQGRVAASGPLSETLCRLDLPAAFADDAGTVVTTVVGEHAEDGLTRLDFPGGAIWVSRRPESPGHRLRCRIHARDVSLAREPQQSSILNSVAATILDLAPTDTPGHVLVRLDAAGTPLLARITQRSVTNLGITPGLAVHAQIKAVALLG